MSKLKTATVKATGKKIQVYKLNRGTWCDYADCTTEYTNDQLIF